MLASELDCKRFEGGADPCAHTASGNLKIVSLCTEVTKVDYAVFLMRGDTKVRQLAKVSERGTGLVLRTCPRDKLSLQVGRKKVSLGRNPRWHSWARHVLFLHVQGTIGSDTVKP